MIHLQISMICGGKAPEACHGPIVLIPDLQILSRPNRNALSLSGNVCLPRTRETIGLLAERIEVEPAKVIVSAVLSLPEFVAIKPTPAAFRALLDRNASVVSSGLPS